MLRPFFAVFVMKMQTIIYLFILFFLEVYLREDYCHEHDGTAKVFARGKCLTEEEGSADNTEYRFE